MSAPALLTVNAGSSTVKFGVYAMAGGGVRRLGRAMVDRRRDPPALEVAADGRREALPLGAAAADLRALLGAALDRLAGHFGLPGFAAAGHRIVHGGDRFAGPVRVTAAVLSELAALVPLAPLHQPQSLALIEAVQALRPELPQTASFDTAFHRSQSDLVRRFALPRALFDRGIKRYGFHGLSYRFIAGALARRAPAVAAGRVVAAHLGSGASLCALQGRVSRDTTMGFSTLDGLPMATRCGALDPGVLLHLLRQEGLDAAALEDLLYHRSGLAGVSGLGGDARVLAASDAPEAKEALALFALQVARQAAALATTMGGLDGLVFTAGIGEHHPAIRAAICGHLAWTGVTLDPAANAENAPLISTPASRIAAFVIPTDEEQVIAEEAATVLG